MPPGFRAGSGASHKAFPSLKAKKRLTFDGKLLANAELSNYDAILSSERNGRLDLQ